MTNERLMQLSTKRLRHKKKILWGNFFAHTSDIKPGEPSRALAKLAPVEKFRKMRDPVNQLLRNKMTNSTICQRSSFLQLALCYRTIAVTGAGKWSNCWPFSSSAWDWQFCPALGTPVPSTGGIPDVRVDSTGNTIRYGNRARSLAKAQQKANPAQQKPALFTSISQIKKKDIPLTRQEEKKHGVLGTCVSPSWLLLCTWTKIHLSPLAVIFGYPLDGEKEAAKTQRHYLDNIQASYI